ncbi:MAG: ADP-ribosylglycohydrolase family protein [Clostridia bacterium]
MDTGLMTASDKLAYEMRQSRDEGRDISQYEAEMREILTMPAGDVREARSLRCLNWMATCPPRAELLEAEPSDWEGILRELENLPPDTRVSADAQRLEHAWLGRAAGCLLGKPFECVGSKEICAYFGYDGGDTLPSFSYFRMDDSDRCKPFAVRAALSVERLTGMPSDDDTNYTVIADELLRRNGRDFTSLDLAHLWMSVLPAHRVCTAERVAYRNLLNGLRPPESARLRNPYREWIGAQIRTDYYGYINPGAPLAAASMAYRDACVTHTRNGIYGAMWVSATLAIALSGVAASEAALQGMTYIPPKSRLYRALSAAAKRYRAGETWKQAMDALRAQWHEEDFFEWGHTISNAVIVLQCLLYGEGDFERTIGMAMLYGFDTDCNGATAGSIFGAAGGVIPEKWTAPMQDTLYTDLPGRYRVSLHEMAHSTLERAEEVGRDD